MEWIKFFLQCIIDSSNQAIKRIQEAVDERSKIGKNLQRSAKFSGELSRICDFIETKPVFMINDLWMHFRFLITLRQAGWICW